MEISRSIYTEPIARAKRFGRAIALMHGFTDRHTAVPFMAMSEHYTPVNAQEPVQLAFDVRPDHLTQPVLDPATAAELKAERIGRFTVDL